MSESPQQHQGGSRPEGAPAGFRGRINYPVRSFLPVLVINGVFGGPAYLIGFVVAYGFREQIGWTEHGLFLTEIMLFAIVTGLSALLSANWEPQAMAGQILTFGVLTSLALNATAVGLGSIVSALNKDQGSVSADFSTITDVLVAATLFVAAGACVYAAQAVRGVRARG